MVDIKKIILPGIFALTGCLACHAGNPTENETMYTALCKVQRTLSPDATTPQYRLARQFLDLAAESDDIGFRSKCTYMAADIYKTAGRPDEANLYFDQIVNANQEVAEKSRLTGSNKLRYDYAGFALTKLWENNTTNTSYRISQVKKLVTQYPESVAAAHIMMDLNRRLHGEHITFSEWTSSTLTALESKDAIRVRYLSDIATNLNSIPPPLNENKRQFLNSLVPDLETKFAFSSEQIQPLIQERDRLNNARKNGETTVTQSYTRIQDGG